MRRILATAALFSALALGACSHTDTGRYASADNAVTAGSGSTMPPSSGVNTENGYGYNPWGDYGYDNYGADQNTGPNTMYQND